MSQNPAPNAALKPQRVAPPPAAERIPLAAPATTPVAENPKPPAAEAASSAPLGDRPMAPVDRVPLGSAARRLSAPTREGYKRRWIDDRPGRIDRAKKGGWTHVNDEMGRPECRIASVGEGGGGLNTYLMEIPEEWWMADQAAKQRQQDATEAAWKGNGLKPGEAVDGRYVPDGAIKINDGRRRA